ncbi:MAG: ABC transporter ATP-binding protein [Merdibacter sp.]
METIITAENVKKSFQKHTVLDQLELHVQKGEFLAIVGASGCGKSTLLNILGLLDRQDEGDIILFGEKNIRPFSHQAQVLLKEKIGYLFQNYALLEDKSIAYNLEIVFSGRMKREEKRQRIMEALEAVGLKGMEKKKVCQCSGGEQQRAAMARLC